MKKLIQISVVTCSCLLAQVAGAGTLSDILEVAKNVTSAQGNGAIGVNMDGASTTIRSVSTGPGSSSTAALASVEASAAGGKRLNVAVGINSGTANITAVSDSGGSSTACLACVKTK
ncbi:MAG: hypothetical protein RIR79_1676 [Pseudomonadota bacterium]